MNNKFKPLMIVQMCLIAIAVVVDAINIIEGITKGSGIIEILSYLFSAFALFFGGLYLIFDFKKSVAVFYKLFVIMFALSVGLRTIISYGNVSLIFTITSVFSLVDLLALVFVKDLGMEKTSYIYAAFLACEILTATAMLATNWVLSLSTLLLAGTFGLMITFKYIDKASRDTD